MSELSDVPVDVGRLARRVVAHDHHVDLAPRRDARDAELLADLEDAGASFALNWEKATHTGPFGAAKYLPDPPPVASKGKRKPRWSRPHGHLALVNDGLEARGVAVEILLDHVLHALVRARQGHRVSLVGGPPADWVCAGPLLDLAG